MPVDGSIVTVLPDTVALLPSNTCPLAVTIRPTVTWSPFGLGTVTLPPATVTDCDTVAEVGSRRHCHVFASVFQNCTFTSRFVPCESNTPIDVSVHAFG
jgi:hypothetical protein